jgi:FMN phosphatase YigB (HAD superfamily)
VFPSYFLPDAAVIDSLGELHAAGFTIGVITNGPSLQRRKAESAALLRLIDVWCISEEIGVMKPDPFIFEEAIRRCGSDLGARRGECMVGDSAVPDLGGGAGVGLRTIWLHHGRPWEETAFAPDHTVASIPEAVALILASQDSDSGR